MSYSDPNHVHAATTLGSLSNPYASYEAMGNMTCRNIDTTSAHTCTSGSANAASMTYDAEGRMDSWTAPSGTTASDKFLYDNEGNRVLQRTSTTTGGTTTVTDDITFDSYTEVTISGGTTSTAKYYSANGQRIAMRVNGILSYLLSDMLGSSTVALNSDGSGQAAQLFSPYGSVRYSWGSMPTTYNFTGQRLDSQTGLLYYNFRYYDPVSGRFMRADTTQNNAGGMDPYAYVGDNPETKNDPTGHRIVGENGGYANLDPQGNLTIWTPFPWYGSGGGYNDNWNYGYHREFIPHWLIGVPPSKPPTTHNEPLCNTAMASFSPTTKIATSHGPRAISSLHPGDKVWAYNMKAHGMELQPVVHVSIHNDDDLVDLTITLTSHSQNRQQKQKTSEVLHTTQKHPFLTTEKGFVLVDQLHVGMHVVRSHGDAGTITSLKNVPGAMVMYNLEIAQDHNYTVGDGQWVVHNCTVIPGITPSGFNAYDPTLDPNSPTPTADPLNGIEGASYDEILSRIPRTASMRYLTPSNRIDGGVEWSWRVGNYEMVVRIHRADAGAPVGSNAANGWTMRVIKYPLNNGVRDSANAEYQSALDDQFHLNANFANDTHIPIDDPPADYFDYFYLRAWLDG